jgi:DNA-nicking Smr family endonuclease
MQKQTTRGARLLLIITGKGKDLQGVLRNSLPGWLMAGEFKHQILTIHPAHIRHGGDGATYVLLRRTEARS